MQLSVCTDAVFRNETTTDAMRKTKEAGLDAIEFWSWWDKDLDEIKACQEELGMRVAAFCVKHSRLVDGQARSQFLEGLSESIEAAEKLGCDRLITTVGDGLEGVSRNEQIEQIIRSLQEAKPLLEKSGKTIVLEPPNTKIDHPGYFMSSSEEAFDIIRQIDSPNIKVLFDIYHQQITEGDILRRVKENIVHIGHFHAAGVPGRHELDTGELHYGRILETLLQLGYSGFFGLEYFCTSQPDQGLREWTRF